LDCPLEAAAYVGDNLIKDVSMAKEAGVTAIHAAYGESHRDSRYQLLVDVSHWPARDVARQQTTTVRDTKPDHILAHSFSEITKVLEFGRPVVPCP
jgi:phosphoglycolate phosphatase-like HAD superfamily hydrolase